LEHVDDGLEVVPGILDEITDRRGELMRTLLRLWDESFTWEENFESANKNKTFTLVFKKPKINNENNSDNEEMTVQCNLKELMGALNMLRVLNSRVKTLADNIHNNFFR